MLQAKAMLRHSMLEDIDHHAQQALAQMLPP
jgi:hypothetical protein